MLPSHLRWRHAHHLLEGAVEVGRRAEVGVVGYLFDGHCVVDHQLKRADDALIAQVVAERGAGLTEEAAEGPWRDPGFMRCVLHLHIVGKMTMEKGHGLAQGWVESGINTSQRQHKLSFFFAEGVEEREAEAEQSAVVLGDDGTVAGDCFHQLYAVVAVGSQVDALTPRVLDHHLVRRTIVDKPDKAALFFIHSSYTISSCHWHDMRSLWHYLQILHKDNILILQSKINQ